MTGIAGRRTGLYRLYNAAGTLIYIGVAVNPTTRWTAHSGDKNWWPEVDGSKTHVAWYETRAAALDAERVAIGTELPIYNVAHQPEARRGDGKARRRRPTYVLHPVHAFTDPDALARLRAAAREFEEGRAEQERRRLRLAAAIVKALQVGIGPSAIKRVVPYDRQHIDRIRRAAGIPARRTATVRRIPKGEDTEATS